MGSSRIVTKATSADEDTKHNTVSDHMKKHHNSDKQKRHNSKFIKIGKIRSLSKIAEESSGQHLSESDSSNKVCGENLIVKIYDKKLGEARDAENNLRILQGLRVAQAPPGPKTNLNRNNNSVSESEVARECVEFHDVKFTFVKLFRKNYVSIV